MPSVGSTSILRLREALRDPFYVPAKVVAPFRSVRSSSSRQDEPPPRATPYRSRFASQLPSMVRRRCLSPTSAIDSRHEHPRTRSTSGRAGAETPCTDHAVRSRPRSGSAVAASDHLAAIQTPAVRTLDGARQLQPNRTWFAASRQRPSSALRAGPPSRDFFGHEHRSAIDL
jgi:hypothetical protein